MHRDPANFSPSPESFLPERWLPGWGDTLGASAGYVHNEAAFIPFSYGPMNCVGKGLAMQEMRAVVVALMQRFHIRAAGGDMEGTLDLGKYERGYKDVFVSARPPLPVVLEQREGSV